MDDREGPDRRPALRRDQIMKGAYIDKTGTLVIPFDSSPKNQIRTVSEETTLREVATDNVVTGKPLSRVE